MTALPAGVRALIDGIIEREGGFVDHPADPGGATMWGITERVARAAGWRGQMPDLPRSKAFEIYLQDYYLGPRFDWIAQRDERIAEEMTDTGVNMGPGDAVRFLQQALNAFNQQERYYADIGEDGMIGGQTLAALDAYLKRRGNGEGAAVLLATIDHLQAGEYVRLARARKANEAFVYGWIRNRTFLPQ